MHTIPNAHRHRVASPHTIPHASRVRELQSQQFMYALKSGKEHGTDSRLHPPMFEPAPEIFQYEYEDESSSQVDRVFLTGWKEKQQTRVTRLQGLHERLLPDEPQTPEDPQTPQPQQYSKSAVLPTRALHEPSPRTRALQALLSSRQQVAHHQWVQEQRRTQDNQWRQEQTEMMAREVPGLLEAALLHPSPNTNLFQPRAGDQCDEARLMAKWAQMVEGTVQGTEHALITAAQAAGEAHASSLQHSAEAEREAELAFEAMLQEVEMVKAQAIRAREAAFESRARTSQAEQAQAEELAKEREEFEAAQLQREARHREAEATRVAEQQSMQLRRQEREQILQEEEHIRRCEREETAALRAAEKAQQLHAHATHLHRNAHEREEGVRRREQEQIALRRSREKCETELEAMRRGQEEIIDFVVSKHTYHPYDPHMSTSTLPEAELVARSVTERLARTTSKPFFDADVGKIPADGHAPSAAVTHSWTHSLPLRGS